MSAATTAPRALQDTGTEAGPGLPGRTTLADRVVERVATQAITEIADVGGAAHRLFGDSLSGSPEDRSAQVSATVEDGTAALRVRLSIAYPASVARTTREVRDHLVRRIDELTGLVVTRVDITVGAFYLNQPGPRRVR